MEVFIIIWFVISLILMIVGNVWAFIDWKNKQRKKAPMLIVAVGCLMMAVGLLVFPS